MTSWWRGRWIIQMPNGVKAQAARMTSIDYDYMDKDGDIGFEQTRKEIEDHVNGNYKLSITK